MKQYVHNDPESVRLRNLNLGEQHMLVCHSDGSECEDGCDIAHSPQQLTLLEAAFEEADG